MTHVDLIAIDPEKPMTIEVPVELVGKAIGTVDGGQVHVVLRTVPVKCKPAEIPTNFTLDISSLKIGDATLFLCDDFPEYCGGVSTAPRPDVPPCITLHLDVANCDAAIDRAVTAGATVKMPATDMFWGDRYGQVTDPFGHAWSFAHPLTDEQSQAAQKQWAQQCG